MKLYYAPGACSLADHIALHEAGAAFEVERVDIRRKTTADGGDFRRISPKGYVPVLILEDGQALTENIAVLDWLAARFPRLSAPGEMGRSRQLEALAFISTEIHRAFKPMWHGGTEQARAHAAAQILPPLELIAGQVEGAFLFGEDPTVADFYLFVMLLWAKRFEVAVPERLAVLCDRLHDRPAVRQAMQTEGLI